MSSAFIGFSEEEVQQIKSGNFDLNNSNQINRSYARKVNKIGAKSKKNNKVYSSVSELQTSQEGTTELTGKFEKCKLGLTPAPDIVNSNAVSVSSDSQECDPKSDTKIENFNESNTLDINLITSTDDSINSKSIRCNDTVLDNTLSNNYSENEQAAHKATLEDLQLRQKLMEEQNKKRKEMLAKALADRTKQTEEEVMKLEKIKQELQVLDGQFSKDVSVLRKKIDQTCISYSEAQKTYLKVEKDFLQAKLYLQKEKEKKELLTEHLCALITHNETRMAQKLEQLMLKLADDGKEDFTSVGQLRGIGDGTNEHETAVIVDGVDEKTGKIVDINLNEY